MAKQSNAVVPFRVKWVLRLVLIWMLGGSGVSGQTSAPAAPTEYQIKAAFVFNFAKFVEWPASAFLNTNSPIILGILGDNPFGDDLANAVHNKKLNNRSLAVVHYLRPAEVTNCQLLFISNSEKENLAQIFNTLRDKSVLTVGEMDHFTEAGGMINFVQEGTKMRFQINEVAAKSAGLKISSKLMRLALPQPDH